MRTQRITKPTRLSIENIPFTSGSRLEYTPAGKVARLSIYPALESGFPDVENIEFPIRDGMKAPAVLFSDGWAVWVEIEKRKRAFFGISTSGDFLKCESETPPTGTQWLIIQADENGSVEVARCFPADFYEPFEQIKTAAILYEFEKGAKPITSGQTKILPIDRERLIHNFTAELSAPGASYSYTGPVSEIRAKKMDVDSFKYWKRAFLWQHDAGKSIIAETTLGGYHVATFDSNGRQQFSDRATLFTAALRAAHNQLSEL